MDKIVTLAEARGSGLKRYYTGQACKYGHVCQRMVSNRKCLACLREQKAAWNKENVDRRRESKKAWDKRNEAHVAVYAEKYLAANEELCKKRCRDWHARNKEHHASLNKVWREENKEYFREYAEEYRKVNKDKIQERVRQYRNTPEGKAKHRVSQHNRDARIKSNGGRLSSADIKIVMERQRGMCVAPNCNKSVRTSYHIDHRMPISKGGTNDIRNIDILCPSCNMRKNAKHPVDFAQEGGWLL